MKRTSALVITLMLVLTACGGGSEEGGGSEGNGTSGGGGGGQVVNQQPPGQAMASVDGRELTLTEPGAVDCSITSEAITFGFRIGDNEVTLGAGANLYDDGWLGGIDLIVWNPEGEDGPISYYPDLAEHGDRIAVDGESVSYSGPMLKQPPNDGSNPPPVEVGEGTISATCG